jgi:cholestenol Delta-isomerase
MRPRGGDLAAVCLLGFFILASLSIELYYVLNVHTLPERTDLFAKAYALYGKADRAYDGYGDVSVPLALETINVFVTQILNLILVWAIVRRKAFRHPLQLTVSAYVTYSVVFYLWLQQVSHYQAMPHRTVAAYLILVLANLPWLAGYLYLGYQSFLAIFRRFSAVDGLGDS